MDCVPPRPVPTAPAQWRCRAIGGAALLAGLLAADPRMVAGQGLPPSIHLASEDRERLAQAQRDSALAPWQRDLVLQVLQGQVDNVAASTVPRPRAGAVGVYDPIRNRMLTFGGSYTERPDQWYLDELWQLSLAQDPAWTLLTTPGQKPGARSNCTAIYDTPRDRLVLFGGYDGANYNDVWTLTLTDPPTWALLSPAGTPPPPRQQHTAIYDPVRERMIVYGGLDRTQRGDVWTLALSGDPTWTQVTPTGPAPSARAAHAAIYDPTGDRMVVFGGYDGTPRQDVWALSLGSAPAWTEIVPAGAGPSGRSGHTALYRASGDQMIVLAGFDGQFLADVWALSLSGSPAWTPITPSEPGPAGRWRQVAILDAPRDRLIMSSGSNGAELKDLWTLSLTPTVAWTAVDLSSPPPPPPDPSAPPWVKLTPAGTAPSGRFGHSAIYDPARRRMVVFGGNDQGGLNDVWVLSLASGPVWSRLTPNGPAPAPRWLHSAILDPVRDRMVVCGGRDESRRYGDVWALSFSPTPSWTELRPAGIPPDAREGHSAVYDPVRDRMVVFGGYAGVVQGGVWALSFGAAGAWNAITPASIAPPPRFGHVAIYDPPRDRMVVFAGHSGSDYLNDTWALYPSGWLQISAGSGIGFYKSAAVYRPVGDQMAVCGGDQRGYTTDDTYTLTFSPTPKWSALRPPGTLFPRRFVHSAIYDPVRDRMIVFGGWGQGGVSNDVWALTWGPLQAAPDCAAAVAAEPILRPPNHHLQPVTIAGIVDSDGDPLTMTFTNVTQDEPVTGRGDRNCPDARIQGSQLLLRAERNSAGSGRLYEVHFTADDGHGGRCNGVVTVCVPRNPSGACVDDGQQYDSTAPCDQGQDALANQPVFAVTPTASDEVRIRFTMPEAARAELSVFDVAGRRRATLESGDLPMGIHERVWQLDGVPKGLYFVRIRTGETIATRSVLVTR